MDRKEIVKNFHLFICSCTLSEGQVKKYQASCVSIFELQISITRSQLLFTSIHYYTILFPLYGRYVYDKVGWMR